MSCCLNFLEGNSCCLSNLNGIYYNCRCCPCLRRKKNKPELPKQCGSAVFNNINRYKPFFVVLGVGSWWYVLQCTVYSVYLELFQSFSWSDVSIFWRHKLAYSWLGPFSGHQHPLYLMYFFWLNYHHVNDVTWTKKPIILEYHHPLATTL